MPRSAALAKRSPAGWFVRIVLAIIVAAVGVVSVKLTLAQLLRRDAGTAHALAPGDGRLTAAAAQSLVRVDATPADLARAGEMARLALRQDPTSVRAAVVLGLVAQVGGDMKQTRRAFGFAHALSRRDLQTHLWAIEDAVARDDIPGALLRYDMALRTSRTAPDLLFPILSAAAGDRQIQTAIVRTLAAKPPWAQAFISYLAGFGTDPRGGAVIMKALPAKGVPVFEEAQTGIIRNLLSRQFVEDAWSYYAFARGNADRRFSRDPDFTAQLSHPAPFDWVAPDDAGVSVSILPAAAGGSVEFSTTASIGGTVVQQLQILPAGNYKIVGRSEGIDASGADRPYWMLRCSEGREAGRVYVPSSAINSGSFGGTISVPANCSVQTLALIAPATSSASGLSGRITKLRLSPAEK